MPIGPETRLVGKIRQAIKKEFPSAFVTKIAGGMYQTAGLPDLAVIINGRFIGIEVKSQRDNESETAARLRATPRQLDMIDRLRDAGAIAGVALTVDEALALCREAV